MQSADATGGGFPAENSMGGISGARRCAFAGVNRADNTNPDDAAAALHLSAPAVIGADGITAFLVRQVSKMRQR